MIISEQEIKRFLDLSLKFEDSNIPKAMKTWNKQDSIIEDGKYFSIEEFGIYKNAFQQFIDKRMNKNYLLIYLNIARGALVNSSINRQDEGKSHIYMNLVYKITEAIDVKLDESKFIDKMHYLITYIDEIMEENKNNKN